jgi:hypothetical protein
MNNFLKKGGVRMNLFKSLKNRKGLSGAVKASIILLTLAFVIASVSYIVPAFASHTAILTVTPSVVQGNTNTTFTMNVANDISSAHPIHEVRLYFNPQFSDYICLPTANWFGPFYAENDIGKFCLWTSKIGYEIQHGNSENFKFIAVTPATECNREVRVETRDNVGGSGDWNVIFVDIAVDKTKPLTTKSFDGPKKELEGVEWIDGVTKVVLEATDCPGGCSRDTGPHDAGIDKILYLNVLAEDFNLGENPCLYPQECQPMFLSPPTACVLEVEEYCDKHWKDSLDNLGSFGSWEECVEYLIYYECFNGQGNLHWQVYTGPFQKEKESCHILEYYSIDGVGNTEDVKVNCFFVDKTPPVLIKNVGEPSVDATNEEEVRYGKVSWTTSQPHSGTSSAELYVLDGTKDWAGIDVEVDIALEDITSLTFWELIKEYSLPKGWSVNVILGVDTDGDGVFESDIATWHVPNPGHNPTVLGDDVFIEMDGVSGDPTIGVWTQTDAYNTSQWWTTNANKDGLSSDCYETLPNIFSEGCTDKPATLDPTDHVKLIKLEIGGSSSWNNEKALVDELALNGGVILDDITPDRFTWVSPITDITFNCIDQQPHPSDDEKVCFKVSFDKEPFDLTSEYCSKYGGVMGEDGFCCKAADENNNFVFNFNFDEDSMHDLEYYCKDAVEKKTETEIQWYKVDSVPPVITKTIGQPNVGECYQGSQGKCYIQDHVTPITVDVKDNAGAHDSGVDYCSWSYTVDSEPIGEPRRETSFPFVIIFPEDSTHVLTIECFDKLGNKRTDIETFLVDSTPPVTQKTYGDPTWTEKGYRWITSGTPIDLSANDVKVGVDKIYWRVTPLFITDESCLETCKYEGSGGWQEIAGTSATFKIPQDSCHLIEFYAIDKLGNKETTHRQCVFVDNKPPIGSKDVGDPNMPIDNGDEFDYYVTKNTPITLNCVDSDPHPVDHNKVYWRFSEMVDGKWVKDAEWHSSEKLPVEIYFPGDCYHDLEYYCEDALGNKNTPDTEYFIVETIPPETKKTYDGITYVKDGKEWVDTITKVVLTPIDPEPHPSDVAVTKYRIINLEDEEDWRYCESLENCKLWSPYQPGEWLTYENPFTLPESCNIIEFYSEDKLENKEEVQWQCVYSDHTAPLTRKWFVGPQYPNDGDKDGTSHWIAPSTEIHLEATDPEPHPSGVKETYYRFIRVDDNYCRDQTLCQGFDETITKEYDKASPKLMFNIPEESCHLIEYYSVDNVGKVEDVKRQCVFVDNSAPEVVKTISDPKEHWAGDNTFYPGLTDRCWSTEPAKMIECWKITMGNTLNLDCKDPDPHPVDHNKMCFKIELDGDDVTEKYCSIYSGTPEDGWCCKEKGIENFQFWEESQHDLKVKCVDALGNEGKVDEEKFKVEGCTHELCLYKKWNLISVPFVLFDDKPETVFKDMKDDIASVWSYDNSVWSTWIPGVVGTLEHIKPGYGYWILAKDDKCFEIAGSLFSPLEVPPSRELQPGWNLIGYYGNTMMPDGLTFGVTDNGKCTILGKPVYCALNSLVDTQQGFPRWSSLWNYFNTVGDHAGWIGLDACCVSDEYETCLQTCKVISDDVLKIKCIERCEENSKTWCPNSMEPGKGYWIEMDVKDSYAPATNCIWNKDMSCVTPILA